MHDLPRRLAVLRDSLKKSCLLELDPSGQRARHHLIPLVFLMMCTDIRDGFGDLYSYQKLETAPMAGLETPPQIGGRQLQSGSMLPPLSRGEYVRLAPIHISVCRTAEYILSDEHLSEDKHLRDIILSSNGSVSLMVPRRARRVVQLFNDVHFYNDVH